MKQIMTILMCGLLTTMGCGGSDGPPQIQAVSNPSPGPGEATEALAGGAGTARFWRSGGRVDQAGYESHDGTQATRVLFNSDGEAAMFVDEISGGYVVIDDFEDGRVDFLEYDANDTYQRGWALRATDDGHYELAEILGDPAIEGQLVGQIVSDTGQGSGSFAVVPSGTAGLANAQTLDATFERLVDILDSFGASGTTTALAGVGGAQAALRLSLSQVLKVAGTLAIAGSLAGPLAASYGAAGAMMVLAGVGANDIADFIDNRFRTGIDVADAALDVVVQGLRDPGGVSFGNLGQRIVAGVEAISTIPSVDTSWLANTVEEFGQAVATGRAWTAAQLPSPRDFPPLLPVDVQGQGVWQDGTVYRVGGTVDPDGSVNLDGDTDDGDSHLDVVATLDPDGSLLGTSDRDGDPGTVTGQLAEVGACSVSQASGGQGTFTNAHYVGGSSGTVPVYYDAYSIPDAFDIRNAGVIVHSSGGLISGSRSVDVPVDGDAFVFVSVSAPESGTAWDYQIGCVE